MKLNNVRTQLRDQFAFSYYYNNDKQDKTRLVYKLIDMVGADVYTSVYRGVITTDVIDVRDANWEHVHEDTLQR